ncbi:MULTISPECIES: NADH-quinone oxidoreductase subunit C [Deefgea]|uniref:NADH-quinone oxidoreductase subunit C n=1 Tax=Deefgea chitinilytica TaxID=570276 RepID=A0ABS2CAI6_9NEIS|nr:MULTISPECIES: NADH-quinone oxidoreductase subunit C [Deefgea]MBM5571173.1 NADH-quinone oxidoreductase subunit C [Deefgea chitinilytica]MBM9888405.1 NADH-quinone oxidoreductase subunit C [Deefgea sp. CFH1-16]
MATKLETLMESLRSVLGESKIVSLETALDEVTLEVSAANWPEVALQLRDNAQLQFEQLIDACGMDYSTYKDGVWEGNRFATVYHFLSYKFNVRLRVRVFCVDDSFPVLASVVDVWPAVNWFERESFDLFGIVYLGHPDLRRLLTDYGFVGHPFRKDFPLSGYVEMRYDADQARVIYQPVTIDPREITPRIIREENYGG